MGEMIPESTQRHAVKLVNWISDKAIDGVFPLSSAAALAEEYLIDNSYCDTEDRVDSLINWETTKNFTGGFLSGLGGLLVLPFSLPAGFGASWIIQARMAAAIAKINGHNLDSDRVRTFVMVALVGDSIKDILKGTGIVIGRGLAKSLIAKIPGRALIEINKRVGFRLLTKAGEKGAVNVMKGLPVVGGLIGGTFDAAACRIVGKNAKKLFGRSKGTRRMRPKRQEPSRKVIVVPAVWTRPSKRDREVYGRIFAAIKEAGDNGINYADLARKTGSQHATLKTFVVRNPDKVDATRAGREWKLVAR
jgi:hypothetical protein